MLSHYHTTIFMNLIMLYSQKRKTPLTNEQLDKIEKNFTAFSNRYNKIINFFVNSKYSNYLKELFSIGMKYPTVIYCDVLDQYVQSLNDGTLEDGRPYSDCTVASLPSYAMDISKLTKKQQKEVLNKVNSIVNQEYTFRIKRVITYN